MIIKEKEQIRIELIKLPEEIEGTRINQMKNRDKIVNIESTLKLEQERMHNLKNIKANVEKLQAQIAQKNIELEVK